MRNDRLSCRGWIVISFAASLMMIVISPPHSPLVLLNRTPSLPTGLYIHRGHDVHRGDIVAFALPTTAWPYAHARGESTNVILLKHVLAVRGDFVSTLHGELRVNGVLIGAVAAADSAGRRLPQWIACRFLTGDELLAGSTHAHSFDSRYFGPIHAGQVIGVYRKLTFPFSSADPSDNGSLRHPRSLDHTPPIAPGALGDDSNAERWGLMGGKFDCVGQGKGRLLTLRVTAASIESWALQPKAIAIKTSL